MKAVVDLLQKNSVICKSVKRLELNTRKKVEAFLGINLKNEYCLITVFRKKSRFVSKDLETLYEIEKGLNINFRYKKKILMLNSPICSKAREKLKDWRILWF